MYFSRIALTVSFLLFTCTVTAKDIEKEIVQTYQQLTKGKLCDIENRKKISKNIFLNSNQAGSMSSDWHFIIKKNEKIKKILTITMTSAIDKSKNLSSEIKVIKPEYMLGYTMRAFYKQGEVTQYVKFPNDKEFRRFKSIDINRRFLGSNINYYDLNYKDIEDYNFNCNEQQKIIILSNKKETPYSKIEIRFNKKNLPIKAVFFNSKKNPEKTFHFKKYKKHKGIDVPLHISIISHHNNIQTEITFKKLHYLKI